MAQNVKIVRQSLAATISSTTDFVSTGFGTVEAAIFVFTEANTTNNPADSAVVSVGVYAYEGGTPGSGYIAAEASNGVGTSVTERRGFTGKIAGKSTVTYEASAITDGVRLTVTSSSTGLARYCTAILLNGVSADVHSFRPASTALSTATKTGLSFAPELLLFLSFGSNLNVSGAHWITTLGYAKKTGSLQGMTGLDIPSGLATSATDTMYATNRVGGQMFNGSVSWMGELTSWTSDGYTITTRTSGTGDDDFVVLALGGADLSVVAGEITTPTATGNSDVTTTGIDPDAVFISLLTADSTGTIESSGSQAEGWCIGMAEGSTNYSHSVCNADNVGTTVCRSKASTTNIIDLEDADSGSTFNQIATASASMGTEKFTLNYSVVDASSQRKGFYLAFGPATGGGGSTLGLKLGSTTINQLYLGSTSINKAYLGATVVYDNA